MTTLLLLPPELTIYTVAALQPAWQASLAAALGDACEGAFEGTAEGAETSLAPQPLVRVAAAEVNEVDAAGLQLLVALLNAVTRRRGRLQLVHPSRALTAACTALGVTVLLDNAELEGAAL